MDDTLEHLIDCLQFTLKTLNGPLKSEIATALHNDQTLPNKHTASLASKAIDLLHETEQLLEPSPIVLADHFLGYANSKCLSTAVELGIPDHLRDGPLSLAALAKTSHAREDRLRQVLRVLSNNGIFSYDSATDKCENNRTSILLLSDHWTQWRNWIDLYGSEFYDMARGIPDACKMGATRSPAQIEFDTDKSMFAYFTDQGWTERLHKTLGGGAIAMAPGIQEDYPWADIADCNFLDVGGGAGALVALVLRKYPSMQGGVLDLDRAIEQAKKNFHSPDGQFADVGKQVPDSQLMVGDFSQYVPGFEVYTMKWCLHDWDDSKALQIMSTIRKSIKRGPRSRLIIFESILANGQSSRLSRYADLNMWMAANGQERTEAQWRKLAKETGWTVKAIYHLRNSWPCAIDLRPIWPDRSKKPAPSLTNGAANGVNATNGITSPASSSTDASIPTEPAQSNGSPAVDVSGQVTSTMTFIEPWNAAVQGNPFYRSAPSDGFKQSNFRWIDSEVTVTDARPHKSDFSLDRNGFAYVDDSEGLTTELSDALRTGERETVQRLYYSRVERLVKRATGASRVIIFDHTVRKRDPGRDKTENPNGKEQPATTVHCDQSGKGALRRLEQNLAEGDDVGEILKGRVQMINVWRPLRGPVVDWPLAQMDFTSLDAAAAVHPCDLWRGSWEVKGQTVTIEHDPAQRWYYLSHHRTDEVTMLKIWDSAGASAAGGAGPGGIGGGAGWGEGYCSEGIANVCPHAAFRHPSTPAGVDPRESVEVRCLVLHDPPAAAPAAAAPAVAEAAPAVAEALPAAATAAAH